jgi:hypothetical protein
VMRTVLRFVVAPVFGFLAATRVIWVGILVVLMALLFAASSLVAAVSFFWALANLIGAALARQQHCTLWACRSRLAQPR